MGWVRVVRWSEGGGVGRGWWIGWCAGEGWGWGGVGVGGGEGAWCGG